MDAGFDGFQGPLKMEMHVGDDGHADLRQDFLEGGGILLFRNGHAHDVRAGGGELVNLGHALVDVPGVARRSWSAPRPGRPRRCRRIRAIDRR